MAPQWFPAWQRKSDYATQHYRHCASKTVAIHNPPVHRMLPCAAQAFAKATQAASADGR
jgi:hypothetical protein